MPEIQVAKSIWEENEKIAEENALEFAKAKVFVINIMSSPGAGKTTLLEKTLSYFAKKLQIAVIEGDLQTTRDSDRIAVLKIPVVQINTDEGCHLDARMVQNVLPQFDLPKIDLLFIENVGNLVCPASFELGEHKKVVLLSVPEGSDKPIKYPKMFYYADVVILTKLDLLEYCDFDLSEAERDIKKINSKAAIFKVSCRKEIGLDSWYKWIADNCQSAKKTRKLSAKKLEDARNASIEKLKEAQDINLKSIEKVEKIEKVRKISAKKIKKNLG